MTDIIETDSDRSDTETEFTVKLTTTTTVVANDPDSAKRKTRRQHPGNGFDAEVIDDNEREAITPPLAVIKFHPQRWVGEYARPTDSEGEDTFAIPLSDAIKENGEIVEDNSRETDALKRHERAPMWVRAWDGPYRVEIIGIDPGEHETVESAIGSRTS